MWCPIGEGHADSKDPESPQKLDLYFDTPTGKKLGTKPAWILKTDYTRYCISCAFYLEFNNISTKHHVMCKVCEMWLSPIRTNNGIIITQCTQ